MKAENENVSTSTNQGTERYVVVLPYLETSRLLNISKTTEQEAFVGNVGIVYYQSKARLFDNVTEANNAAISSGNEKAFVRILTEPKIFIIVNPDSRFVSFSDKKHDICFGDRVFATIPNYKNADYIRDYGGRVIDVPCNTETDPYKQPRYDGIEKMTIAEYLDRFVFRHDKSNCQ